MKMKIIIIIRILMIVIIIIKEASLLPSLASVLSRSVGDSAWSCCQLHLGRLPSDGDCIIFRSETFGQLAGVPINTCWIT